MAYNSQSISIVTETPGFDRSAVDIVVTIPTYKRPDHIVKTLNSVMAQKTTRRFAVIVMENDSDGLEGALVTRPLFENGSVNGTLLIAKRRGNCEAYNAGWQIALERYPNFTHVLIIDDDELASEGWLERMYNAATAYGADIVGGPQTPVFENPVHQDFYQRHPVFSAPYSRSGPVKALYSSGNLLVSRKVLLSIPTPWFDLRFNFMGGGDADLMNRSVAKGFKLAWCHEAPVLETVPERRTQSDWIRARALRNGVISTLVERRQREAQPFGRVITFARSLSLLAVSPIRAILRGAASLSPMIGLYQIHVGLGRVLGEFGYSNEQYRNAEKN